MLPLDIATNTTLRNNHNKNDPSSISMSTISLKTHKANSLQSHLIRCNPNPKTQKNKSKKRTSHSTVTTLESMMCGVPSGEFERSEEISPTTPPYTSSHQATRKSLSHNSDDTTTATLEEYTTTSTNTNNNKNNSSSSSPAIYYFGYGPIVNPIVRYRRGCTAKNLVRTAILYDHRLRFVEGGTANVVPARGWDVKGVLLQFDSMEEFEAFRHYDANYSLKQVSVSLINKTNLDPRNKNASTAPFSQDGGNDQAHDDDDEHDDQDENDYLDFIHPTRRHKSCPITPYTRGSSDNDNSFSESGDDDDDEEEEDYSCPFSLGAQPKSKKEDPHAIQCYTFVMETTTIQQPTSLYNSNNKSLVCKPQERYLKLITDGLRGHEIDETYIRDEILAVDYIPNETDSFQKGYRKFLSAKKVSKLAASKYETKLCKPGTEETYFLCGKKVVRVDDDDDDDAACSRNNPCVRWLRAVGHGKGDVTLMVHKTFVDPESLHLPFVDSLTELTDAHSEWAEHTLVLFLQRGGLTATVVHELTDRATFLGMGTSMPSLFANMSNAKPPTMVKRLSIDSLAGKKFGFTLKKRTSAPP